MDGIAVLAGILAGVALGGLFGWLLGGARVRAEAERMLRELEGRSRAASATADELRRSGDANRARAEELELQLRRGEGDRAALASRAGELERGMAEQRRLIEDAKNQIGRASCRERVCPKV